MSLEEFAEARAELVEADKWRDVRAVLSFLITDLDPNINATTQNMVEDPNGPIQVMNEVLGTVRHFRWEVMPAHPQMARFKGVRIGDLPKMCREEILGWQKVEKRCGPVARKILSDKNFSAERIETYPFLLKNAANELRRECSGMLDAVNRYTAALSRWAKYIEDLRPISPADTTNPKNMPMPPRVRAEFIWSSIDGLQCWLGEPLDGFDNFAQRIEAQKKECDRIAAQYMQNPGSIPLPPVTVKLREPRGVEIPLNAYGEPLKTITHFRPEDT